MRQIQPDVSPGRRNLCAFVALQLYLFAPLALFVFFNNYFPISAVQPFLLATILALDKYIYCEASHGRALAVFTGASFAGAYTDWQMHLLLATVVVIGWASHDRKWRRAAWIAAGVLAISTGLLIVHYSTLSGLGGLLSALWDRFVQRSGFFPGADGSFGYYSATTYRMLAISLVRGYGPIVLFNAMLASACLIFIGIRGSVALLTTRVRVTVILLFAPAAAYHILLFNHAGWHNYSMLAALGFLATLAAVLVSTLFSFAARMPNLSLQTGWLAALCLGCTAVCGLYFAFQYYPAGTLYRDELALADFVKKTAGSSDRIFINRTPSLDFINPVITLYSGRNIGLVDTPADVTTQLEKTHSRSAILIQVDAKGKVVGYTRIHNNAESEGP
jgi:hypothetical protein